MRVVIQRVKSVSVEINHGEVRSIGPGLLILLGISDKDDGSVIEKLANKCANLRIFDDENGKQNLSAVECGYSAMIISNFTLYADTKKGMRPNFMRAAKSDKALPLYQQFVAAMQKKGLKAVQCGEFGADMQVSLINDGPITILIDTDEWSRRE